MRKRDARNSEQIYRRPLPGGGFVTIEATPVHNLLGKRRYRGDVVVERRTGSDRRIGHDAPIVACAEAQTIATIFHELFPVAQSNAALATKCLAAAKGRRVRAVRA
jgi:hypothetical protein